MAKGVLPLKVSPDPYFALLSRPQLELLPFAQLQILHWVERLGQALDGSWHSAQWFTDINPIALGEVHPCPQQLTNISWPRLRWHSKPEGIGPETLDNFPKVKSYWVRRHHGIKRSKDHHTFHQNNHSEACGWGHFYPKVNQQLIFWGFLDRIREVFNVIKFTNRFLGLYLTGLCIELQRGAGFILKLLNIELFLNQVPSISRWEAKNMLNIERR
jgi:hypothetical protein